MARFKSHILPAAVFLLSLFTPECFAKGKVRTIVIFFSWNASMPAYQNMLEGFQSTLSQESGISCNILTEYLDINRSENDDYTRRIVDLYNFKYRDSPIDLVVVIGPGGYPLLKSCGLEALEYAPVISVENAGLNGDTLNPSQAKNLLNIALDYDFRKTLTAAFQLFPDRKRVYVISGNSLLDKYYVSKIKAAEHQLKKNPSIEYISDISLDSVIHFVETVPSNSMIFVPVFTRDKNRISYNTSEVISIIAKHCTIPILPVVDTYLKRRGGLGGYVFSFSGVGKEAGRVANLILNGQSPSEITVDESGFYRNIYDWEELKKWGLQNSKLIPSDSQLYYYHPSFMDLYKWYIIVVFIFLIIQSFLIIYLVKLTRRQKAIALQKEENEHIYRELVREDRLLKMFELTASLSHELNQPLTAILYNAQAGKRFLQSGYVDLKQTEEIFDYIIEDDKRAGGIISSVRSLMKLEDREKENINLQVLVQETLDIFHSEAIKNNVKVETNCFPDPVWVYADKIQLQQVMLNFMRNAINAMEGNLPENRIMVIMLSVNKGSATVSVHDSGPGIDADIRDRLFKPFVTNNKKGFGIGLALSRSIIEKHNGQIWALNLPGSGAQFSFRLKIARDAE